MVSPLFLCHHGLKGGRADPRDGSSGPAVGRGWGGGAVQSPIMQWYLLDVQTLMFKLNQIIIITDLFNLE